MSRAFQTGIAYGSSSSVLIAASFSTPQASTESILNPIANFIGALWPLVALAAIGFLFWSAPGRQVLSGISRSLRRVKFGQFELELTPDTAPQVKAGLEEALASYRSDVKRQFDIAIQATNLELRRDDVAREVISQLPLGRRPRGPASILGIATGESIRCTVYAPDSLIADSLYCLLDYWPSGDRPAGQAYSARYGIIGKCWRERSSQAVAVVPADEDQLVREWGMTRNEARSQATTPKSVLAVVLRHERVPVGVVFAEAPRRTFERDDWLKVEQAEQTRRLAAALHDVLRRVSNVQPRVHVFVR